MTLEKCRETSVSWGGGVFSRSWTSDSRDGWDEVLGCCRGAFLGRDDDDDTSVVRASEPRSDVSLDPRTAPGIVDSPMAGISVPEPLEHSVLGIALDGRPMEGMPVLEPLEHSVLDVALEGKSMEGISALEPLEHSVLEVIPDGRPTWGDIHYGTARAFGSECCPGTGF